MGKHKKGKKRRSKSRDHKHRRDKSPRKRSKEHKTREHKSKEHKKKEKKRSRDKSPQEISKDRDEKNVPKTVTVEERSKEEAPIAIQRQPDLLKDINIGSSSLIIGQPPEEVDIRGHLQKRNTGHKVNNVLDASHTQYSMFGDDIPNLTEAFLRKLEEHRLKSVFKVDEVVKSAKNEYRIAKVLKRGQNVFYVGDDKGKIHFMKAEIVDNVALDSQLLREVALLKNAKQCDQTFRKHFLEIIDVGRLTGHYNFIITSLGSLNVNDIRGKLGKSQEFLKTDAVRLCMQTLQAIHDVHLCHFIHRDIQPRNFIIGPWENAKVIYVVNFGLSFQYFPKSSTPSLLPKEESLSRSFQARAFHTGSRYLLLSDMECWLYLCYWFFDSNCLPWLNLVVDKGSDERRICNSKQLFFCGLYDDALLSKLGKRISRSLEVLRNKINTIPRGDSLHLNYSFFGDTLLSLSNELAVDWKAPYQWEDYMPSAPGVEPNLKPESEPSSQLKTAFEQVTRPKGIKIKESTTSSSTWDKKKRKETTTEDTKEDTSSNSDSSSSEETTD